MEAFASVGENGKGQNIPKKGRLGRRERPLRRIKRGKRTGEEKER